MVEKTLIRILADQLCFLELSDSRTVSEDAAVQQMESIVAEFESLSAEEHERVSEMLRAHADEARAQGQPNARVEFIESLPEVLGLEDGH